MGERIDKIWGDLIQTYIGQIFYLYPTSPYPHPTLIDTYLLPT